MMLNIYHVKIRGDGSIRKGASIRINTVFTYWKGISINSVKPPRKILLKYLFGNHAKINLKFCTFHKKWWRYYVDDFCSNCQCIDFIHIMRLQSIHRCKTVMDQKSKNPGKFPARVSESYVFTLNTRKVGNTIETNDPLFNWKTITAKLS